MKRPVPDPAGAGRRVIVGITGASGALYAVRTVRALLLRGFELHLVVSKFGERLLHEEAGIRLSAGDPVEAFLGRGVRPGARGERAAGRIRGIGTIIRHPEGDLGAAISSGSFRTGGMVVVPCTTKTLSGIAHGTSSSLIERAADVCLKERRPVILVLREAPLSLVHLRNAVAATEAGAIVLPASPAFYQKPATFEDLGDFIAGRVLGLLGMDQDLFPAWGETTGRAARAPSGPGPVRPRPRRR